MDKQTEIIIANDNSDSEIESLAILMLHKAKRIKKCQRCELFTKAYINYDPTIPRDLLALREMTDICSAFIKIFKIKFKEDILYLVRHPELTKKSEKMGERKTIRITFDRSDRERDIACRFLENSKSRARFSVVDEIMHQFFVVSQDQYYLEQSALRLMEHLQNTNSNSAEFHPIVTSMVDVIWANRENY